MRDSTRSIPSAKNITSSGTRTLNQAVMATPILPYGFAARPVGGGRVDVFVTRP
jgi:hypothetical protein